MNVHDRFRSILNEIGQVKRWNVSRIEGRTRSNNDIFQRGEFMRASLNNHPSIPSEFAFGEEMQISLLPPEF